MRVTNEEAMGAACAINDVWDTLVLAGGVSDGDLNTIADSVEKICYYICHSKEVADEYV